MATRTELAQSLASRVIRAARERKCVITRQLIAEITEAAKAEGAECADAFPRTVITSVRNLAACFALPVALSPREVQLMWRAVFRNLSRDQGFALKEKLFAEQPELEDDFDFVHAFQVGFFPKSCATAWTHYPRPLENWGRDYAWTFVTGLESIQEGA